MGIVKSSHNYDSKVVTVNAVADLEGGFVGSSSKMWDLGTQPPAVDNVLVFRTLVATYEI